MNLNEFMLNRSMTKRDLSKKNQNCPSGHTVNSAHKKTAFDIGEKSAISEIPKHSGTVSCINHEKKL